MESLCNTIAGDAPLYTMFRKGGDLVKCPFRGPYSFSYSKGGRGQVCSYPPSYLDSCDDNRRMKLKYQACTDVEGSEVSSKTTEPLCSLSFIMINKRVGWLVLGLFSSQPAFLLLSFLR